MEEIVAGLTLGREDAKAAFFATLTVKNFPLAPVLAQHVAFWSAVAA
jgi:hypothetical protein